MTTRNAGNSTLPKRQRETERDRENYRFYLRFDLILLLVDAETLPFRSFMLLFLALDLVAPVNGSTTSMPQNMENKLTNIKIFPS